MSPHQNKKKAAQALMETRLMARLYESFLWRRSPLLALLHGVNSAKEYQTIFIYNSM